MDDRYADEARDALEAAGLTKRPVGLLDLDAVDRNLDDLRRRASGKPIRVASKSLRVRRLLDHSLATHGFRGILAYTLAEALWLVGTGHDDVVLGYPSTDGEAIRTLSADEAARDAVTLMVDSVDQLDLIDRLAPGHPVIRVALELDAAYQPRRGLRFGALRSPIRTPEDLATLAREVVGRPGFRLVGVMAYEAQIAGVTDAGAGAYPRAVRAMKRRSARDLVQRRAAAVAALAEIATLEFVNGGGTGSFESTAREDAVTELAAGSGIVGPGLFDRYATFSPEPALHFGFDVVRRPGPKVATLLGGGWVASGVPGRDRLPTIAWPDGLRFARDEAAGEVQTPVCGPRAATLKVGDIVWLRHAKAGEPAERVDSYAVARRVEGTLRIVDEWPTYRGEAMVTL